MKTKVSYILKNITAICISFILIISSYSITSAATVIKTWNIGENDSSTVTATLYQDGLLDIQGSGNTKVFTSSSNVPWVSYKNTISRVTIGSNVAPKNMDYWFRDMKASINDNTFYVPNSVTHMLETFRNYNNPSQSLYMPNTIKVYTDIRETEKKDGTQGSQKVKIWEEFHTSWFTFTDSTIYFLNFGGNAKNVYQCLDGITAHLIENCTYDTHFNRTLESYSWEKITETVSNKIRNSKLERKDIKPKKIDIFIVLGMYLNYGDGLKSKYFSGNGYIEGDWFYDVPYGTKEVSILGYIADESQLNKTVTIPNTIDSKPVTTIGAAFANRIDIKTVRLPDTITTLNNSFSNCTSLENIIYGASLKTINDYTFKGCSSLKSTKLPASVTSIGNNAFEGSGLVHLDLSEISKIPTLKSYICKDCKDLQTVNFGIITTIPEGFFAGCNSLIDLGLSPGIVQLGNNIYEGCTFKKATLPDYITTIGSNIFKDRTLLETVTNLRKASQIITSPVIAKNNCINLYEVYGYDSNVNFKNDITTQGYYWAGQPVLDNTPPIISDVQVNSLSAAITATDNIGISAYGISLTNNSASINNWQISNTFTNLSAGKTYYAFAKDASGNISVGYQFNIPVPDTTTPIIDNIEILGTTVLVTATDNVGVTQYGYSDFDRADTVSNWQAESVFRNVPKGTQYYMFAKDAAGNVSLSSPFMIELPDTEKPVVSKVDVSGTTATITAVDNKAVTAYGTSLINDSSSISNWQASSQFSDLLEGKTYYAFAKDGAGNISTGFQFIIPKLDREVPIITNVIKTGIAVTITATDNVGITAYGIATSNDFAVVSNWQASPQFNSLAVDTNYYAFAKDAANNISSGYHFIIEKMISAVVSLNTTGIKTEYFIGEDLDLTNLSADITYNDGTTDTIQITSNMITGFNKNNTGTQIVTITFAEGLTRTFSVDVKEKPLVIDTLGVSGVKTTYQKDEAFSPVGNITVNYTNGTSSVIPIDSSMVKTFDTSTAGQIDVVLTYQGKDVTYKITVKEDLLESIRVDGAKLEYVQDELFYVQGNVILTYQSGNTKTIALSESMLSGFDTTTLGTKTIIVEYLGVQTTYSITVKEKPYITPVSIEADIDTPAVLGRDKTIHVRATGDFKEISTPSGKVYVSPIHYKVFQNGTYIFSVLGKDNESTDSKSVNIDTIDREAPEISFAYSADFSTLIINASDNYEVEKLILPDSTEIQAEDLPYELNLATASLGTFTALDTAGNSTSKDIFYKQISIGGSTNHTYVALDGLPKTWTNQDVDINVGAYNPIDGVTSVELVSGIENRNIPVVFMPNFMNIEIGEMAITQQVQDTQEIFDVQTEDNTQEEYVVYDVQDIYETQDTQHIHEQLALEKEKPEPKLSAITPYDSISKEATSENNEIEETGMEKSDTSQTPIFYDATDKNPIVRTIQLTQNGTYTFKVVGASDEYVEPVEVNYIDKEPPEIQITVQQKNAEISITDNLSGIKAIRLPDGEAIENDNDGILSFEKVLTLSNGDFEIFVEDYAGNTATKQFTINGKDSDSDDSDHEKEKAEHFIIYHLNGAAGKNPPRQKVKEGGTCIIANIQGIVIPSGMTFKEWNTKMDGNGLAYQPDTTLTMGTSDIDLYLITKKKSSGGGSDSSGGSSGGSSSGGGSSHKKEDKEDKNNASKDNDNTIDAKREETVKDSNSAGGTDRNNHPLILKDGIAIAEAVTEKGYISGYPDATFRANSPITRQEFAAILDRILILDVPSEQESFKDVAGLWGENSILRLSAAGIVVGIGNQQFAPERPITREEVVMMLARALDLDAYSDTCPLTDIENLQAKTEIAQAFNAGIINGNENLFRGKDNISRAEVVTIINKIIYSDLLTEKSNKFTDIQETDWFYQQVLKATSL